MSGPLYDVANLRDQGLVAIWQAVLQLDGVALSNAWKSALGMAGHLASVDALAEARVYAALGDLIQLVHLLEVEAATAIEDELGGGS